MNDKNTPRTRPDDKVNNKSISCAHSTIYLKYVLHRKYFEIQNWNKLTWHCWCRVYIRILALAIILLRFWVCSVMKPSSFQHNEKNKRRGENTTVVSDPQFLSHFNGVNGIKVSHKCTLLFIIALIKMPCIMRVHSALHKYTAHFIQFNAYASRFHLHHMNNM